MMTLKTGALIFDETADRYDIRFDVNDYYGACIAATAWRSLCGQMEADPYGVRGHVAESCSMAIQHRISIRL